MLETSETAPPAARRDRSLAARRAARQAKASRESRIVESLNRGVSLADIAERERVGEKRMRVIVDEILARRMPKPPAEFVATQVSRLEAALGVAYDAMAVDNLRAVALVVKIVRELDRYHGSAAAERWGLPEASRRETPEEPDENDKAIMAHIVERIRRHTLDELARANATAAKTPDPRDMALDAAGRAPDPVEAPPTSPQMAPQSLEKIDSAPGNGMGSGTPEPQDMAGAASSALDPAGRTADPVEAPSVGPQMAPQSLEKIDSAPGNGMGSAAPDPQDRVGAFASALDPAGRTAGAVEAPPTSPETPPPAFANAMAPWRPKHVAQCAAARPPKTGAASGGSNMRMMLNGVDGLCRERLGSRRRRVAVSEHYSIGQAHNVIASASRSDPGLITRPWMASQLTRPRNDDSDRLEGALARPNANKMPCQMRRERQGAGG